MNVLASSWRRSLAAAAVAVFLAPISGDAVAQEHGEREALERRLDTLRTAMHALREAERGDAIELVERAIHAGEVTLEGRRDDEAHQIRERAPGPGQLAEILTMAAELWRKFENPEKAEIVGRLADELRAEHRPERDIDRPRRERRRHEAEERERDEVVARLNELKEAHEQARRDGRQEEASRLLREAEALKAAFERRGDRRGPDAPPPSEREEVERRMMHIRAAIENLHAAGLDEQANRLAREAEHFAHGGPRPDRPAPHDAPPPPGHEGRPHPEQPNPAVVELGNQIRQLNERIEQMGRKFEQAVGEVRQEMARKVEEKTREFEARVKEIEQREQNFRREVEARGRQQRDNDEDDEDDDDR